MLPERNLIFLLGDICTRAGSLIPCKKAKSRMDERGTNCIFYQLEVFCHYFEFILVKDAYIIMKNIQTCCEVTIKFFLLSQTLFKGTICLTDRAFKSGTRLPITLFNL